MNNNSNNVHKKNYVESTGDENEIWGEDLTVDEDFLEQLETQAFTQCPDNKAAVEANLTKCRQQSNFPSTAEFPFAAAELHKVLSSSSSSSSSLVVDNDYGKLLLLELQTKSGEVKNLRRELENIKNDCRIQVEDKNKQIHDLRKQLSGKQSEIEFQKMEKFSQNCRTPKSTRKLEQHGPPRNTSTSHQRNFIMNDDEMEFSFAAHLNKGDVLFKLLDSAFNFSQINDEEKEANSAATTDCSYLEDNIFMVLLNTHLLQLCRSNTFHKSIINHLIKHIIYRSYEVLMQFLKTLERKEVRSSGGGGGGGGVVQVKGSKSKIIAISRNESVNSGKRKTRLLLANVKWFPKEKGIAVRQTITMLAKLLQVHPPLLRILLHSEESSIKCEVEKLKMYLSANGLNSSSTDFISILYKIIEEIIIRKNSYKYEGVISSILYFASVICSFALNGSLFHEKHKNVMVKLLQIITFSSPELAVIHYIFQFLNNSAQYHFSNSLCQRSAAETFSENCRSFCFTESTCMLQVLCAYTEIIEKSPSFAEKYTAWIIKIITKAECLKWMRNKRNSKLCECLPTLEQIVIKIILHHVANHKEKWQWPPPQQHELKLLENLVKRCLNIFKYFRHCDIDFNIHIARCKGEYKMMLIYIGQILPQESSVKKSIIKELQLLEENKKFSLSGETKNQLIYSISEFTVLVKNDN